MADLSLVRTGRILFRAGWRSAVQYRGNFLLTALGGVALQGTQLLFIGVLLARFGSLAGWSFGEIGLLYAVRLAAHAVYVIPFGNLIFVDQLVHDGEFDRLLLRPAGIFLQIIAYRSRIMALGDAVLGVGALIIFGWLAPVDWTLGKVIFLLAAVIGGGLVETGIQAALSGLTFLTVSSRSLRIFADNLNTTFAGYPLTMFGRWG